MIGTAYPISGTTGGFVVSRSTGDKFGVATSVGGTSNWPQTGVKFKRSTGWSTSWPGTTEQRSFRIKVEYKKYKTVCYLRRYKTTSYDWRVVNETGGTGHAKISRPNFTHCTDQDSNNIFRRNCSTGSSYSNSAGVKILGTIGIDLSTERNYAASSALVYKTGSKVVKLCGSDKKPAYASKVMHKKL